ncbi:hypothetical protein SDC9_124229 [bioreactor metagenome]|uniref:Uncharacterized protein n=1 Tax=bioreactor metagenome TaxID=1076179 RepID=A0A645CJW3_9ZZZZ
MRQYFNFLCGLVDSADNLIVPDLFCDLGSGFVHRTNKFVCFASKLDYLLRYIVILRLLLRALRFQAVDKRSLAFERSLQNIGIKGSLLRPNGYFIAALQVGPSIHNGAMRLVRLICDPVVDVLRPYGEVLRASSVAKEVILNDIGIIL